MPSHDAMTNAGALMSTAWDVLAIVVLAGVIGALLVRRTRWPALTIALRFAMVLIAAAATLGYLNISAERERAAERRAFAARQTQLASVALVAGSPLACLDDLAGETVENACEKAIFQRPETAAAAVSYMAAKLSLLADASRYVGPGDADFADRAMKLRRSVELDRYGLGAHVLANRDGCTAESCSAFAWVEDATALKANLRARAFNGYVDRYAALWAKPEEKSAERTPVVAESTTPPANTKPPAPGTAVAGHYDFPSAASIPPVSIMNAEPRLPDAATPAASARTRDESESPPLPPKRPPQPGD